MDLLDKLFLAPQEFCFTEPVLRGCHFVSARASLRQRGQPRQLSKMIGVGRMPPVSGFDSITETREGFVVVCGRFGGQDNGSGAFGNHVSGAEH